MSNRMRVLGGCVTAGILLAIPAGAAAAVTAKLDRRCYTHVPTKGSQPIVVSVAGGTPGDTFVVVATVPGKGLGSAGSSPLGMFDAAGNATAVITNVFPPNGTINPTRGQKINLTVEEFDAAGESDTPIGSTLITTLSISVANRPTNPRKPRRVQVSGTPFAGRRLYGFVVKPNGSRVLRRISLGRGDVCGYASAKAIVAPRDFRTGTYRLYINAGKKLKKRDAIGTTFRIVRRF